MLIFALLILALFLGGIGTYLWFKLRALAAIAGHPLESKPARILAAVAALILAGFSLNLFSTYGIVLLHFYLLAMAADGILALLRRPKGAARQLIPLAVGALITAGLVLYGGANMTDIRQTRYTVDTTKAIRPEGYRVVLITDVHYDTIQDPAILAQNISAINDTKSDLVILGGDIVEEGTGREQMQQVFRVFGEIESTYGTYYIYGNHDRQTYSRSPRYTQQELADAITENGITILRDETAALNDEVLLLGREDLSHKRQSAEALLAHEDPNKLILIADHQPSAWRENSAAGGDVQFSGHTHAGQVWPANLALTLFGTPCYGRYEDGPMTLIVSSGLAGWGFTVRTSAHCEYAVIDIV